MKLVLWSASLAFGIHERLGMSVEDCALPALQETLDWGPLSPDAGVQLSLRQCYFRQPLSGTLVFDEYLTQIPCSEGIVFWCERVLPGCLIILWAIDHLVARGVELQRAFLALSPRDDWNEPLETAAVRRAFQERSQIGDALQPLIAIWRHVASDSDTVVPDLSPIPEPLRGWAATTERMADFLPDSRGLDLLDAIILGVLSERWRRASSVLIDCLKSVPARHNIGDIRIWQRLLELSGQTLLDWDPGGLSPRETLIEARHREKASVAQTSFRLTPLGAQVEAGEVDALERLPYCRWVGGRMTTNDRPLRRNAQ